MTPPLPADYSVALRQLLSALRCPACTRLRSAPQFAPWLACECKEVR